MRRGPINPIERPSISIPTCFICKSLCGAEDIPWTDRPLLLDPRYGGILPGVGPLIAGYVLICPIDHSPSFCRAATDPSIVTGVEIMMNFIGERFGTLTYFEHGGASAWDSATSSCVDHAHIHVIPGILSFELPGDSICYPNVTDFLTRGRETWTDVPYLMSGNTGSECRVAKDIGMPQYFRRQLAAAVDDPDSWDYAAAPRLERVRETIGLVLRTRAFL
jgi:hypothetical protein